MVVWIGKDCWDKILSFKKDIEEAELLKERLSLVHSELIVGKVDNVAMYLKQRKTCNYYKQHHTWNALKPITLFFTRDYLIEQIYNERQLHKNILMKVFYHHRHFKIRIILIDDIEGDVRLPRAIVRNLPNIERIIWRRDMRRRIEENEIFFFAALGHRGMEAVGMV